MSAPNGIWPMLYAFFDDNNRLDRSTFRRQIAWCLEQRCQGVAMLGLLTEVSFLTLEERQTLVDWAVAEIGGRVPLLVTVAGRDVGEVVALAQAAKASGADYLVLQPPLGQKPETPELVAFYAAVMAEVDGPVGIQNAPEYLGVGLEPADVMALRALHPQFTLMKGEGPVVAVKRFLDALPSEMAVFNGRGGLELVDNLMAGCAGMIPAPETLDLQLRIYDAVRSGDLAQAERLYATLLPYVVFAMQSIPVAVAYGKRAFISRAGLHNAGHCRIAGDTSDPFLAAAGDRWLAGIVAAASV